MHESLFAARLVPWAEAMQEVEGEEEEAEERHPAAGQAEEEQGE